jgi:hypothetical protein
MTLKESEKTYERIKIPIINGGKLIYRLETDKEYKKRIKKLQKEEKIKK